MNKLYGKIMSKDAFLNNTPYAKEPYEGIMVSLDTENNQYKIAVQLSENQVLLVDKVKDTEVQERLIQWIPRVNEIQLQYGVDNDLENYSRY
ncbi:hypothetical protein DP73_12985 [Desulfosporosinus sp. HMP52]|uniref:hypothetical protein n=1 Tax=Desulfosporosinus sp. HMP52 TaxID=1487923 RepID=UPI00051FDF9C|nr:hypothetical protein [Desulfosporosinus sp. HMP52]KGK88403.1 hypothetical protein DP73_12985 [Desulfosporosinus sp. HMP52]